MQQVESIKKSKPMRVRALDVVRGVAVVNMVLYHAMFDVVYIFGHDIAWYRSDIGYVWQQAICWTFIFISGASLHYGQKTLQRSLLVLGCAMALTLGTLIAAPELLITMGILHLLGFSMLISVPLRRVLHRVPAVLGFVVCFALFLLTKTLPYGSLGVGDVALWELPPQLYSTSFLFPLGFRHAGYYAGDYFPIFPWVFLFYAGYFAFAKLKIYFKASERGKNPFEAIGRRSLLVYMLHQPLTIALLFFLWAVDILPLMP